MAESTERKSIRFVITDLLWTASPFLLTRVLVELGSDYYAMVMLASLDKAGEHDHLAAASLIEALQGMTRSVSVSALYYSAFMINQVAEDADVGKIWRSTYLFALLMLPAALVLMGLSQFIFKATGQGDKASDVSQDYFYGYMPGFLFTLWFAANQQLLLGLKNRLGSKAPWMVLGLSVFQRGLYLFLADNFTFGKYNFPKLGAKGLGFASSIAVFFIWLLSLLCFKCVDQFKKFDLFRLDFAFKFKELIKKGLHIGLSSGVDLLSILISTVMLGYLRKEALAAVQPTWRYLHFLIGSAFSFSQGMGVSLKTTGKPNDVYNNKLYACCNMGLNLVLPVLSLALFFPFKNQFVKPFVEASEPGSADVANMAKEFLLIGLIFQLFDAVRISSARTLQGLGKTSLPLFVNAGLTVIDMLLMVGLTIGLDWNPRNIILTRGAAIAAGAGVLTYSLTEEFAGRATGIAARLNNWATHFCYLRGGAGSEAPGPDASTPLLSQPLSA